MQSNSYGASDVVLYFCFRSCVKLKQESENNSSFYSTVIKLFRLTLEMKMTWHSETRKLENK